MEFIGSVATGYGIYRIGGNDGELWSWRITLSVLRCLTTVQTKYWLNTQVRGQHMTQGNPDLEICFFAKRSITSILCLIIPVVG